MWHLREQPILILQCLLSLPLSVSLQKLPSYFPSLLIRCSFIPSWLWPQNIRYVSFWLHIHLVSIWSSVSLTAAHYRLETKTVSFTNHSLLGMCRSTEDHSAFSRAVFKLSILSPRLLPLILTVLMYSAGMLLLKPVALTHSLLHIDHHSLLTLRSPPLLDHTVEQTPLEYDLVWETGVPFVPPYYSHQNALYSSLSPHHTSLWICRHSVLALRGPLLYDPNNEPPRLKKTQ